MADLEDQTRVNANHDHGRRPEHLDELEHTRTDIDVIHVTTNNPYKELNFIGTYTAITFATCAAFAGFVMPVTALAIINAEIGPSANSTWVALAWTLCSSVGFTLIGRLSDIFGRRWFFTGCSGLATIGCIIGCTANSINQLIGASVCLGLGAAGQISFNYVLGELVPVRHRFAANGFIFLSTLPFSGLGAYIARLFIAKTSAGWRGIYYLTLALDATATLCWLLFYHPPQFENLHRNRTRWQEVREMDYGGIVLFTGGLILFLLGLSWGGTLHPWDSSYVIGTLVVGAVVLVLFVFYEIYMPLRRPLIPMGLFRNYDYDMANILSIVGGMVYYSASVLFPYMVAYLYTQDIVRGGLLSSCIGGGLVAGQFIGSWIAVPGGFLKYKLIVYTSGLCAFTAGLAGATHSESIGTAMAVCAGFMIGLVEVTISTVVTIVIDDQSEMGTAAGVFGSLRGAFGVIATAIYVSIFQNKSKQYIASGVAPALVKAGLPASSVEPFLEDLTTGMTAALEKIPGVTPKIIQTGIVTLEAAYARAFRITWLATIGFGGLAVIAACASRSIDDKLSHDVIRRLGHGFVPEKGGQGDAEKLQDNTKEEENGVEKLE